VIEFCYCDFIEFGFVVSLSFMEVSTNQDRNRLICNALLVVLNHLSIEVFHALAILAKR
jgi:hypothetical protein